MTEYKFDGHTLFQRGSKVAVVDHQHVYNGHGSRIGSISGTKIYDEHGSYIGELNGDVIRDQSGAKTTIADVKKQIAGVGGISLAAVWLLTVR
jgi:hypothetical protein